MLEGNFFHIMRLGNHVKVQFLLLLLDYNLLALFKKFTGWYSPQGLSATKIK